MGRKNPIIGITMGMFKPNTGEKMVQNIPILGLKLGRKNSIVGIRMGFSWSINGFGGTFPILGFPKKKSLSNPNYFPF